MKRIILILILLSLISLAEYSPSFAFWVWTPETNKWVNPKYAVKETPKEQLDYALEFYEGEDYKKAVIELNKLIKNYPKAREAAEAQYYLGVVLEKENRLMEAFNAYQTVIDKYPFSERSAEIVKRQYEIGLEVMEGRGRKNKIIKMIVGGDYDVVHIFRTVIKNSPYGPFAAPAQYRIGLYLMEKQLYQEARDEFEKVINDYPDSEWVKAAQYQIAVADAERSSDSSYDQKVTQAAVKEFEEFVKTYPDAELSDEAKEKINELREKEAENHFKIAKFYEKHKKYDAARIYYNIVLEKFDDTALAPKALEKVVGLDLRKTGHQHLRK